eukprot:1137360-Pelagomonas_calceolata.AAC.6
MSILSPNEHHSCSAWGSTVPSQTDMVQSHGQNTQDLAGRSKPERWHKHFPVGQFWTMYVCLWPGSVQTGIASSVHHFTVHTETH